MKLSYAMMEALCTSGRRGVYLCFGQPRTLKALARRGLVAMSPNSDYSAKITEAGLAISAEKRKTAVTS
jgi:hypothetical protein